VGQVVNLRRVGNPPRERANQSRRRLATAAQDGILPHTDEKFLARGALSHVTTFHRRWLPHFYNVGQPMFITWRLHGSLPVNRAFPAATTSGEAFVAMDRLLDNASTGPMYLRIPEIASMVTDAIRYRDSTLEHYRLHSFVVMPNHVHLLMTPLVDVSKVMQSLKRFTGREGKRILGVTRRAFWQEESYDRLVRRDEEFQRIGRYIENNPVKAGLVAAPEEFL
jgi:REP element-mobilizing transposase RayT